MAVFTICAILITGAITTSWILYYTSAFHLVGGLLGLTGAFAWLAIFFKALPEDLTKQIQAVFLARVLLQHRTWLSLAGILALLGIATSIGGAVHLQSYADDNSRAFTISRANAGPLRSGQILPRTSRTLLLFPFTGDYLLHVDGLPVIPLRLSPFRRLPVAIPGDALRQPVVIVRPTGALFFASQLPFKLVVMINDRSYTVANYDRRALWIGCHDDVSVPSQVIRRWESELSLAEYPTSLVDQWIPPAAPLPQVALKEGDSVQVRLLVDGRPYGEPASVPIPSRYDKSKFPLEAVLDVPR